MKVIRSTSIALDEEERWTFRSGRNRPGGGDLTYRASQVTYEEGSDHVTVYARRVFSNGKETANATVFFHDRVQVPTFVRTALGLGDQ